MNPAGASASSEQIGRSYDLALIARAADEVWVCFASSKSNPEILRLAPATREQRVPGAVRIESHKAEIRWLIPGVEAAIHSVDLASAKAGDTYGFSDESYTSQTDIDQGTGEALYDRLALVAHEIEMHFHESDRPSIPSIDECELTSIDSGKPTARFRWTLDGRRAYRLTEDLDKWWLQQTYDDANAVPSDSLVPLMIGNTPFTFAATADPGMPLPANDAVELIARLGLEYDNSSKALRRRDHTALAEAVAAGAQRIRRGVGEFVESLIVRLVPSDPLFGMAASFATDDAPEIWPQRIVEFEWKGDVVRLLARPDPARRRVQFEASIDTPAIVRCGMRLTISFAGHAIEPTSLVFDDHDGRLQGRTSVRLAWQDFAAEAETAIEIRIEPEDEV
ncbi:MAG TPA: hypothetical protein VEN78_14475 [Bradyrhizobium sp.]|nr:hypothetical protein [Bradyrhizobium sp.]